MAKKLNMSDDSDEIEGSEIKESDKDSRVDTGSVWVNNLKNPLTLPIVCRVPQKIVIMMRSVERLMINDIGMGALEFGVFLSGSFNEHGHLQLTEDFYVPSQKVSGAAIDFLEEPPDAKKYNGVIHRHPTGCKGFSGTDAQNINKNFDFSLLYEGNEIILGIWNLEVGEQRIQVPLKIEVSYPIYELSKDDIMNKIKKNEALMCSSSMSHSNPRFDFMDKCDVRNRQIGPPLSNLENELYGSGLWGGAKEEDDDKNTPTLGLLHICKYCGEVLRIEAFPEVCESCDAILSDSDDAVLVSNIDQYDEETKQKILDLLEDEREDADDPEDEKEYQTMFR